jgi:hypothetical protein
MISPEDYAGAVLHWNNERREEECRKALDAVVPYLDAMKVEYTRNPTNPWVMRIPYYSIYWFPLSGYTIVGDHQRIGEQPYYTDLEAFLLHSAEVFRSVVKAFYDYTHPV